MPDAQLSAVLEPIDRRAVGHWQRYGEHLGPVLPVLQPILERWSYSAATARPSPKANHGHQ